MANPKEYIQLLNETSSDQCKVFRPQIRFDLAKVIDVYDGDTVTIQCCLVNDSTNTLYSLKVRIMGIDTPEIKTKNPLEKELAAHIRDEMSKLLLGKTVYVKQSEATDKFGRILAHIILYRKDKPAINITDWLISQRYAVAYGGSTKSGWTHLTRDMVDGIKIGSGLHSMVMQ